MEANATDTAAATKDAPADYSHLPRSIADILRECDEKRALALAMVDFARQVDGYLEGFDDLSPNPVPFPHDITIYVYVKDSLLRVVELLRVLRKHGFKMNGHRDNPENKTRAYSLRHESNDGRPGLCIYCTIYGADGARCRYVQVGEKTVPVMQLKCDGDEVPS